MDHAPNRDLAEERRAEIEANFRARGHAIAVPRLNVSNAVLDRWSRGWNREPFYFPATAELGYREWMISRGQGKHWTVANEARRAKIGWENIPVGYWSTIEVTPACPRIKRSWNDLMAPASGIRLPSLEEYAIASLMHRDLTGECFDTNTWCQLRTRFGPGALGGSTVSGNIIVVVRKGANDLAVPPGGGGGRAMEFIPNAA